MISSASNGGPSEGSLTALDSNVMVMMMLIIRNVTLRDAGMYICELNTATVTRSFHELKVITDKMLVAPVSSSSEPVTSTPPSR